MVFLGIHDGHCASACIMVDGHLKALAAEERFTRTKNEHGYPVHAIDYCMKEAGITAADLNKVIFSSNSLNVFEVGLKSVATFSNEDWIDLHKNYWKPKLYDGVEKPEVYETLWASRFTNSGHYYDFSCVDGSWASFKNPDHGRAIRFEAVERHLGITHEKVTFYDHHTCHAYYALYGSPIRAEKTLIFTLDGGGDGVTSTLSLYNDGKINELARSNEVEIARLYRGMTLMLGMKQGEHEFKVMGLAPYVTDRELTKSKTVYDGLFEVKDNLILYRDGQRPTDHYFHFKDAFDGHRFDGMAAAVQHMTEVNVQDWFQEMCKKYDARHAVFAGGVAMNVKLNMLLARMPELDEFYVCPSPTDDTLCVGACYLAEAERGQAAKLQPIDNPYVGPAFERPAINEAIESSGVLEIANAVDGVDSDQIADWLAEGKVVARASGRMEFGQRALGNRSILADPRSNQIVEKINHQIKYRDFWMPFAPVVLAERAGDYFEIPKQDIHGSYMMIAAKTTPEGEASLPAGIHRGDSTARPQILERSQNVEYYDIIKAFEEKTGVGALLNTSFNLHGEPIVCSPVDAISTFQRSDLDVLVMGEIALVRNPNE